jgi:hypothetical protein
MLRNDPPPQITLCVSYNRLDRNPLPHDSDRNTPTNVCQREISMFSTEVTHASRRIVTLKQHLISRKVSTPSPASPPMIVDTDESVIPGCEMRGSGRLRSGTTRGGAGAAALTPCVGVAKSGRFGSLLSDDGIFSVHEVYNDR